MPRAFTRAVSPKLAECELTHLERTPIDAGKAAAQHDNYERALRQAGYEVLRLPELGDHPDGVFVEDTGSFWMAMRSFCVPVRLPESLKRLRLLLASRIISNCIA